MAGAIVKRLTVKKVLEAKDEAAARATVRRVILDNLLAEERLDVEARQLLLGHAKAIKESAADYRQLVARVREKLARDRGFVL